MEKFLLAHSSNLPRLEEQASDDKYELTGAKSCTWARITRVQYRLGTVLLKGTWQS